MKKGTIIIDKGHRSDTPGKRVNGFFEWEFNEEIGNKLKDILSRDYNVFFTMNTPIHPFSETDSLGRWNNRQFRCNVANYYHKIFPDAIVISLHANAFSDPEANGYGSFVLQYGGESERLADCISNGLENTIRLGVDTVNRGVREESFDLINYTNSPSVLLEAEFYTNPEGLKKLKSSEWKDNYIRGIVEGIMLYYGVNEREEETHWADAYYDLLIDEGWDISMKGFDKFMTRGEVFALIAKNINQLR